MSDDESGDDQILTDASVCAAPTLPVFQTESKEYESAQALLRWVIGFLFVLQSKYHSPNSAINLLIKFMFALFCILSRISPFVCILQKSFPPSFHVMRKSFAEECLFSKYPVCPKCHKIYESCDSCVEMIGTRKASKYCNHIQFPEHPHQSRRTECKALLLKSVQFRSGRKVLYTFKFYCYNGIKSTLQKLLMCPNVFSNCQLWRSRPVNNLLSDLYGGQI